VRFTIWNYAEETEKIIKKGRHMIIKKICTMQKSAENAGIFIVFNSNNLKVRASGLYVMVNKTVVG